MENNEKGAVALAAANPEVEETVDMLGLDCQDEVETEAEEDGLDITEETVDEAAEVLANKVVKYVPKKIGNTSRKIVNSKAVAEKYGAVFVNDNTAYLGTGSMLGNKIRIEHLYERKNGQRLYSITEETVDGEVRGKYSKKSLFRRDEVVNKSKRLSSYILSFVDDYNDIINNILATIQIIENNRLLKVTRNGLLDNEVMTTEQIFERLGQYIINCTSDERVIIVEMSGKVHAGIVGRGNKTAYQNFRSLISEIAPENDYKIFKDECKVKGLLITDYNPKCNDCLKTLSKKDIMSNGVRGDAFYSFNFNDEVLEQIKAAHDEYKKTPIKIEKE